MKHAIKGVVIGLSVVCLLINSSGAFAEELVSISLPDPQIEKGRPLMQALNDRKSLRSFSAKEIDIQEVSNILWAASGVNRSDIGKRTAPSAMNWQEIDIYVARKDGLFLYDAHENKLECVLADDIREVVGVQEFTAQAPLNLIFVSDFSKMGDGDETDKMFYSATDTGFISQNVYLYCASEGLATVVLGWVEKDALHEAMKLKPEQKVILTQPVGYLSEE